MEREGVEEASVCERAREDQFLGKLEPIGGLWRWPFRAMKPGDWFTVDIQDKSIGAVRAAAYQAQARLTKNFSVIRHEDGTKVECLSEGDKPEGIAEIQRQRKAESAVLVGGDGDKYLGVLQPPEHGLWVWPLAVMEPGQYFHVDHQHRHPEKVRQFVMLRAAQLSMALSVTANDPEYPGFCRIGYADKMTAPVSQDLDLKAADALLMRHYGLAFDNLNAWFKHDDKWVAKRYDDIAYTEPDGTKYAWTVKQISKPRIDAFVLSFDYGLTLGIRLFEDYIEITGLPKGTTFHQWMEKLKETDVDPFS